LAHDGMVDKFEGDAIIVMFDAYEKGLCAYRNREWDQSVAFFNQALAKISDDPPTRVMIKRCHEYKTGQFY